MSPLDAATLQSLAELLRSPISAQNLPADLSAELLLKGAVVTLQQDGSPEAVTLLAVAVETCPLPGIAELSLFALDGLSAAGNADARSALFQLAVDLGHQPAVEVIQKGAYRAEDDMQQAVFDILARQSAEYREIDPRQRLLTQAYLHAQPGLQQRIIKAAGQQGLENWITIVTAFADHTNEALAYLLNRYAAFQPAEQQLVLDLFTAPALEGDRQAQDLICSIFILYDDAKAREIAVKNEFRPQDNVQLALFLFLSEQWQAYEVVDFDHRLVVTAYENADNLTRKRLLDLSRRSGQTDWFSSLSGTNRMRWLGDLSDADWLNTIQHLKAADRWQDLWRLAQLSAPVWSALIFDMLHQAGWQPEREEEREQYGVLFNLAQSASAAPLTIRPARSFTVPTMDDLTCMTISPDGKTIAIGSSSNAIHLWKINEDIPFPLPVLYGAVPQTRALSYSSSGDYLVAGVGDHSLRIYSADGKAIKTLEGHAGLVRSLAVGLNDRVLYSASFDGTIRSWRFPAGPELQTIHRSQGEIFGLVLSPDGQMLVSAGADRVLDVFQLPENSHVRRLEGHTATITNLVASRDTEYAASYSRDRSIRVWNYLSGKQIQQIDEPDDVITGLCLHPNNQVMICAGYKGQIKLYSISTGSKLYELTSHRRAIIGLAITPDGSTLISASTDGAVTLWNLSVFLQTRRPVETIKPDEMKKVQQALKNNSLLASEKSWLSFTLELLKWKQRFDVQIEGQQMISIGEFDIQL